MSLRVVILGASGFVGGAVLRALAAEPGDKAAEVLSHRAPPARFDFASSHRGSLTALPADLLPPAPHVLIHCASKQIDRDGSGFRENLAGINNLAAAVNAHTRGVIYASSYSVYGEGSQRGIDEQAPLRPQTELARSRVAAEQRLAHLAEETGVKVVVLRTRFVFGVGDRHFLPGLSRLLRSRIGIGPGSQRYSLIDVDDYAAVIVGLARRLLAGGADFSPWQAFNVGYREPAAFEDISWVLRQRDGVPPPRLRLPIGERLLERLARLPSARLRQTVARLRLLGLDHYGSGVRLSALLDEPLLRQSPLEALARHVARNAPEGAAAGKAEATHDVALSS